MSDAKPRRSTSAAYACSHARSSTKDYSAPRRPRELRFQPLESAEDARQDGGRSVGGCSSDNRAKPKPNFGFRLEPKPEVVWRFGAQTKPEPTSWRLPPNRNALVTSHLVKIASPAEVGVFVCCMEPMAREGHSLLGKGPKTPHPRTLKCERGDI